MTHIILNVDSYKSSHYLQYPKNTKYLSSYVESRGGGYEHIVFFGLQMYLKEYLSVPITRQNIDEAAIIFNLHGEPFNRAGWEYILDRHRGNLPIEIEAVDEGCIVAPHNVLVQVVNTDPNCAWLTSYIETSLLRAIWYPTTVATLSWHARQIIKKALEETADSTCSLPFKLHDFGARGVSSQESAAIGGLAHLVAFQGTDTVAALLAGRKYYDIEMPGFSIPAAEHSTITTWGRNYENLAYQNMLDAFAKPNKTVAVVSDSYDIWHAIDVIWGDELKEKIIASGGTLVIRPDSGDPIEVVEKTIERLMIKFGHHINSKGYCQLPDYIRVIQGDGISLSSIAAILNHLKSKKISAENISFGMGANLLQKVNRDTLEFAMKVSAAHIDGAWQDVYKDPITDPKKQSKRGRLMLLQTQHGFETARQDQQEMRENQLKTVFRNGQLTNPTTLTEVRARAFNF